MGSNVSMMLLGAYPSLAAKLVIIEGINMPTAPTQKAPANLAKAIDAELVAFGKPTPHSPRAYNNVGDAVKQRLKNVSSFPGTQTLSHEACLAISSRGLFRVPLSGDGATKDRAIVVPGTMEASPQSDEEEEADLTDLSIGPVCFRHDFRLLLPSYLYWTPEQINAFISCIKVPTLVIIADNGWPVADIEAKLGAFGPNLTRLTVSGSHHCHLDPQNAPAVADAVIRFLKS